jgi:hypothetical protein
MQKFSKLFVITALMLVIGFLLTGCNKNSNPVLSPPANVIIDVSGRLMTVTWDAVDNASGYEVITTSVDCASGNRTIDTQKGTIVVTSSGNAAANVEITGETSIKITLMAATDDQNSAMASAVTAKVMSLGGKVSKNVYAASDYSQIITFAIKK